MTFAPAAYTRRRSSRRPLVVLVEDHQDTRQMYAEFLAGPFEILEAGDGAQALALLNRRRPDLLITDLSLPDLDGFELVRRVRRDPVLRDLPVICLSGYGGYAHEQRAREVGADRLIQKPCLPDMLSEAVGELLRVRRRGAHKV